MVLAPLSGARADYSESRSWFISLSDDARIAIQLNLVLLGHYQAFVDGIFGAGTYSALTQFQESNRSRPTGVLSINEVTALDALGSAAYERFGFEEVDDARA